MNEAPKNEGVVRTALKKTMVALENFSSAIIFIMMILTFADVIGRYILNKPIFGASEMISALLALAIFSGLGVTNARDDHITVELFEDPIRRRLGPVIYEIIIQLFSVAAMTLIAVVLFEHAVESYQLNSLTVVLEMPLYYVTGFVSFLALLSVVSQIAGVVLKVIDTKNQTAGTKS
ncbi:MAG: TRAP transporter small permease [Pseudomonadota bacterium]